MSRNPNDPIPGFEDEFYGTVGHEKRIHQNSFGVVWDKWWKSNTENWEEYRPGKWRLRRDDDGRILAT